VVFKVAFGVRSLQHGVSSAFIHTIASLLAFLCFSEVHAQPEREQFEIRSIEFEGNDSFGAGRLSAQLTSRESPGFLGKFLHSISTRLGRPNEYYDAITLGQDLERLRKFYRDRGFLDVKADTILTFSKEDNTVEIEFVIREGYHSLIDSIAYVGLLNASGQVWVELENNPKIRKGDPFDLGLLEQEIARVRMLLWNAGHPNAVFLKDSSAATRFASTKNFHVVLAYDKGKPFVFGDIEVTQRVDTLNGASFRTDITDDIILNQLDYKPGEPYSHAKRVASEQNLNRLGIFEQARIDVKVPANEESSSSVSSVVSYRPKDKHEVAPEILISDENSTFNLGTGIGYTNRNFFGGARTFSTRLRFRTQTIGRFPNYFDIGSDAVSNVDLTFEMLQPYIFTNTIKGSWSFSLILDKQKPYLQRIVRNKFGFTNRFAEFTNGALDWTLEAVSLEVNPNFNIDSAAQTEVRQLESQSRSVQFNSILSFTIQRDKSNDIFSPSDGFIHSATLEEGGLIPLLLEKQIGLPYTQFYKLSLLGRWYIDITTHRFSILALKLKGGFEEKYGKSKSDASRSIPQAYRFYAGGGGSVRGWQSRELSATGIPELGGNLLLEGSLELRTNVFQSLRDDFLDKIWLVTFMDAGNLWAEARDLQTKDVAIATGFGFRYDTLLGPFRVDFGFRLYDPSAPEGKRWITQRELFAETLKSGVLHFGIGHAF
jgi:outer membrane protein insertion porin family